MKIHTVGHSNHTAEQLLLLLNEFEIKTLCDIRRSPSSRRYPHFNLEPLRHLLGERGIHYEWFEELGGRRRRQLTAGSPNTLLRSAAFRNYADYMMTEEFRDGIHRLLNIARDQRTAVMCAELLYWKCHRMLLSDYLVAGGRDVTHILGHTQTSRHEEAVVTNDKSVLYPLSNQGDLSAMQTE